jgi:hypothetical protein
LSLLPKAPQRMRWPDGRKLYDFSVAAISEMKQFAAGRVEEK